MREKPDRDVLRLGVVKLRKTTTDSVVNISIKSPNPRPKAMPK
jgi:hypothetical protein